MSDHQASPLRAIFAVRRSELPLALLMFSYFFLVISSFWILKPLKKSLFLQYYEVSGFNLLGWVMSGPQAELLAKVLNMAVAFAAVVVFTMLSGRLRRERLALAFTAFFLASYAAYLPFLPDPGPLTVWSFYLFGDLFSTLMVATFFAFLNDSVTPDASKRMYGLVGLGGVVGGVFGSTIVRALIDSLTLDHWLLICMGLAFAIAAVASAAGRIVERNPPPEQEEAGHTEETKAGNPALEGARLVFRSRYLLSVVGIVGLYEVASTILDFQFTSTVVHYLDGDEIGRQLSTVFAITNVASMFVQLFLTSFIMTRFSVGVALMVLPCAVLLGSGAFMVFPALWVGSMLNTADNGFSYSINQSAKESLYVPTTRSEKYKAKAFIDMFVQRFAKALAVLLSLGITTYFTDFESVRWLSALTIPIVLLWILAVRYAGREFDRMTGDDRPTAGSGDA